MKTATFPPVRAAPELRRKAEQVLRDGESLSSFVEQAIQGAIEEREVHAEFVRRGLASGAAARKSGRYVASSVVLKKLESRLGKALRRRAAR